MDSLENIDSLSMREELCWKSYAGGAMLKEIFEGGCVDHQPEF
jgi:hypothetical protein